MIMLRIIKLSQRQEHKHSLMREEFLHKMRLTIVA